MQHGDDAARLANTTGQSIINAYNQEAVDRLHNVQAATAESLYPGVVEAQRKNTEHLGLMNALLRATNPTTIQSAELKLAQEKALGNLPVRLLAAQVEAAVSKNKAVMDVEATDATGNPITIKDVPVSTAVEMYTRLMTKEPHGQLTQEHVITNARNTRLDAIDQEKRARDAEQRLMGQVSAHDTTKVMESPQSQPSIEEFNQNSNAPYTYVWSDKVTTPGTLTWNIPAQVHKVPLPIVDIGGKRQQLTASKLYQLGKDASPQLTVKQILEVMQKRGVIKEKLPWQP